MAQTEYQRGYIDGWNNHKDQSIVAIAHIKIDVPAVEEAKK